jgi:phosphate transport system substrate-binding protein
MAADFIVRSPIKEEAMKTFLTSLFVLCFAFSAGAAEITGAGSTFVYPILAKWADTYKKETGTSVNYQSIGSGGGIKQIQSKTVEFGATDMPLKSEDLAKDDLVQFPIISGAVVPVIHVKNVENAKMNLTGALLADIFAGGIKKWNDPAIEKLNKGLKLPDQAITVVHRSDGSGTSFIWTNYLSKVSADWKAKFGEGTAINWPAGVGGKGNEGVASYVKQIDGSVGYVEYAYALQNKMITTRVENKSGDFVAATPASFKAAAASADWTKAKDYYLILTDTAGKASWPIAGSTFILMHKTQADAAQAKEALKFFHWAYAKGAQQADELNYVSIPAKVAKAIEQTWKKEIKSTDGAPIAVGL